MKKIFVIMFLAMMILIGEQNAHAQDVYVGTSPVTGRDCYIMTETIREYETSRYHADARLKMVRRSDNNIQYLDYTFTDGGGPGHGVWFQNSQGFSAMLSRYDTPIEWEMFQVIQNRSR